MIIDKINELKNLTIQEKALVDYINREPDAVMSLGIIELAQASYVSTSTIIRLCKKIGLEGYRQFKYIYASEFNEIKSRYRRIDKIPFKENENIDKIIDNLPYIYSSSIEYTKSMINRNDIIRATNLIKQAERIEIYANGFNYELGKQLAYKFEGVYKDAFVYNAPHWDHISYLSFSKKKTIAIMISSTGNNPVILDAAYRLKKQNIKLISLTLKGSELEKLCDLSFYVMNAHSELELAYSILSSALQYFGDICTCSLLVQQHPIVQKVIEKVRDEE